MDEQVYKSLGKEYLSSREVAKLFGVTNDYIARLCRQKKISGFMRGGAWFVERDSASTFFGKGSALDGKKNLTSKEAAALYRVTNDYVARLCRQGKLQGVLEGGIWMVDTKSLTDFFGTISKPISSEITVPFIYATKPDRATSPVQNNFFRNFVIAGGAALLLLFALTISVQPANESQTAALGNIPLIKNISNFFSSFFKNPEPAPVYVANPSSVSTSSEQTNVKNSNVKNSYATYNNTYNNTYNSYTVETAQGFSEGDLTSKLQQLGNALRSEIYSFGPLRAGGGIANNIALTQRIDSLDKVTISNVTLSGVSGLTASEIPALQYLSSGGGTITGALTNSSVATSTFSGGLSAAVLNVSSSTASSTFANGITIAAGCFSVNGTCIAGGSGTSGGSDTHVQYNDNGSFAGKSSFTFSSSTNTLTVTNVLLTNSTTTNATSTYLFANTGAIGTLSAGTIAATTTATSTFGGAITVEAGQGTSTFAGGLSASAFNAISTSASSTFANGINLTKGCFSVNGTCVGGASAGGSDGQLQFNDGGSTLGALTNSFFNKTATWLGFGTTTPKWLLQLATSSAPQLALSDGSLTSSHWTFRNAGGVLYVATSSASTFATSTATAFTIDTNGRVGIGTTSPSATFAINGTAYANNVLTLAGANDNRGISFASPNQAPFSIGVNTQTFNSTPDDSLSIGYNQVPGSINTKASSTEPQLNLTFESNYNNGSANLAEVNLNWLSTNGAVTRRPLGININRSTNAAQIALAGSYVGVAADGETNQYARFAPFSNTSGGLVISSTAGGLASTTPGGQLATDNRESTSATTSLMIRNDGLGDSLFIQNGSGDTDPFRITGNGVSSRLILGNLGSATAPALTFSASDLTSGLYQSTGGRVDVALSGLQIASFQQDIGGVIDGLVASSSSNTAGVVLTGSLSGYATALRQAGGAGEQLQLGAPVSGFSNTTALHLFTSGEAQLSVDSAGKVGVGTTSPWRFLSVEGSSDLGTNALAGSFTATTSSATSTFAGGLAVETSGLVYDFSTDKVGIGTASPLGKLDIVGPDSTPSYIGTETLVVRSSDSAAVDKGGTIGLGGYWNGTTDYTMFGAFKGAFEGQTAAGYLASYTKLEGGDLVERMRITSTGNVGIGTTTPWATLAINPKAGLASNQFVVGSSTATSFIISNSGNVGVGTTTPTSIFSIQNIANFKSSTSTLYTALDATYLNITGTSATSTFARGIDLAGGCFSVNGTCVGGASAGGIDTQVQFNDGGSSLGGDAGLTYNKTADRLTATYASSTGLSASYASSTQGFFGSLSVGALSGFLKATAGAVATAAVDLAADVTGILPVSNGGTGWAAIQSGYVPIGNGSSALATSSRLYMDTAYGALGLGTTTPKWLLQVASSTGPQLTLSDASLTSNHFSWRANQNILYLATSSASTFATTSIPILTIDTATNSALTFSPCNSSNLCTSTTTLMSSFNVGNNFIVDGRTGSTTISNLQTGLLSFPSDAGVVTAFDLPIVSASNNTNESYSFTLGASSTPNLTIYGQSNGSSAIKNQRVGFGTTTPWAGVSITSYLAGDALLYVGTSTNTGAQYLTVAANGGTGIGTTSPYRTFSVASPNQTVATFESTGSNTSLLTFADTASTGVRPGIGSYAGNALQFDTNSAVRMLIDSSGNVGIGTTSPSRSLHIEGQDPGIRLQNSGTGYQQWLILNGLLAANDGIFSIYDATAGVSRFTINSSNVGIGTTSPWRSFSTSGTVGMASLTGSTGAGSLCLDANNQVVYNSGSDACLSSVAETKHDIQTLALATSSLALIEGLEPVSFIYNWDTASSTRYGFMASSTAEVDSHLATRNAKGELSGIDDRAILAVIVKAFQELLQQLQNILARLDGTEERLDAQQRQIEELQRQIETLRAGSYSTQAPATPESTPNEEPPPPAPEPAPAEEPPASEDPADENVPEEQPLPQDSPEPLPQESELAPPEPTPEVPA